jgi:ADP-ribose pyrophosphatase YjhB (NUDIX family)
MKPASPPARNQPAVHVSMAVTDGNRLLVVREEKPALHGRWNLPGGHIELNETILQGASRELLEETGIAADATSLLGIYTGPAAILFVLQTPYAGQPFHPGDEIIEARFTALDELSQWTDEQLVGPPLRRRIFADLARGASYPLELLVGMIK